MTQILLYDGGHGLAKGSEEILHRHGLLLFRICEQGDEAVR
jgi:hypothetical protein